MKITIIGSAYPFKGGGISTFNERLAKALSDQGHDTDIVTFTLQYPSFLYPGKTQFSNEAPPEGLKIRRMINSVHPLSWLKTGRTLKKEKPDIIIVRFWLPFMGPAFGTLLRIAKSNRHTKIICIADNIIPHEKRIGDKWFTKYFLPAIDGFICMSRQVLSDLKKLAPTKPSVFHPHPLYDNFGAALSKSDARQHLQLPQAGKYILFFGFIRKYKGLDLLLQAMNEDAIRQQNIKLILAGEYFDDSAPYLQQMEELGVKDSVLSFTDFIPNEEVRYYFSASDLVVQPYRSATQSGITQIAYHFVKPMVVTNVGGLSENVPDGKVGFVVPPDPQRIAKAVAQYFEQGLENEMAAHMEEEKKKYSWEAFIDALLGVLPK